MVSGRKLLDVISAILVSPTIPAANQPKQCLRVRRKEVNCTLFDFVESGWVNDNWRKTLAEKMRMFVFLYSVADIHTLWVYVPPKWSPLAASSCVYLHQEIPHGFENYNKA